MEYVRRGGYTCASVQAWDTLRYVVMSSLQLNLHAERVFKCALIEYGVVWEHSLKHAVVRINREDEQTRNLTSGNRASSANFLFLCQELDQNNFSRAFMLTRST